MHKKTGALVKNDMEAADWCVKLVNNHKLRSQMGKDAKEHVRKNFLITRQLFDYLNVIDKYTSTVADDVIKAAKYLKRLVLR
jgi:trehalose synthase